MYPAHAVCLQHKVLKSDIQNIVFNTPLPLLSPPQTFCPDLVHDYSNWYLVISTSPSPNHIPVSLYDPHKLHVPALHIIALLHALGKSFSTQP